MIGHLSDPAGALESMLDAVVTGGTILVEDVEVDVVQPMLRHPEDIQIHARTMEAIADAVVAQGFATSEEVAELVARLDEWAATTGVVATIPRVVQVSARAPLPR